MKSKYPLRPLDQLEPAQDRKLQFGLGRLLLVTNSLGLLIAISIAAGTDYLGFALIYGLLTAIAFPFLVLLFLILVTFIERFWPKQNGFDRQKTKPKRTSLED